MNLEEMMEHIPDEQKEELARFLKENHGIPTMLASLSGMFDKEKEPNQRLLFGMAFLMHAISHNEGSASDGNLHRYKVALRCGGVMEDPDIHYEDEQVIEAKSEEEARKIYNKINNCSYYYGEVLEQLD